MKISVEQKSLAGYKCDLLAVSVFEGEKKPSGAAAAADKELGGLISKLLGDGEITGTRGTTTVIHCGTKAAGKVVVAGLGKQAKLDLEAVRTAASAVIKRAQQAKGKKIASIVLGSGCDCLEPEEAAKAVVEGSVLGMYEFTGYAKEKEAPEFEIAQLALIDKDAKKIKAFTRGARLGLIIAEAENHARDLVNQPSNIMTPAAFAKLARHIARINGLKFVSLDPRKEGMGALMSVAKGSDQPPHFVTLEYRATRVRKRRSP